MYRFHTDQEILEVVGDFLQKLADSDYNHNHRVEIIRSECRRFSRREIEDLTGGKPLYRMAEQMRKARKLKIFANQYWLKLSRGGKDLSPRKDLPYQVQEKELSNRKRGMKSLNVRREGGTGEDEGDQKSEGKG